MARENQENPCSEHDMMMIKNKCQTILLQAVIMELTHSENFPTLDSEQAGMTLK